MTTTTLQIKLQRSRFAHHAMTALADLVSAPFRLRQLWAAPELVLTEAERASREARELREMARGYARSQPAFAADLCAAADRHELKHAE